MRDLQVLDTLPEKVYDDPVLLAAEICDTPVALISLVDADRQWFKAKLGIEATETHRDLAFCTHANFYIDRHPVMLARVVTQAYETLVRLALGKGVELRVDLDPGLPVQVQGDALRIRQVLLNLIGNAIKFSSGAGRMGVVDVRVRMTKRDADQCHVEFAVTDNGIGIDKGTQARIFSPFTQADAGTTKRFGGTGLGLNISHRLAVLMGGSISVDSQLGAGSCFTLRLPFDRVDEATAATGSTNDTDDPFSEDAAETMPAPISAAGATAVGRRILVAEDNEINQQVIDRQLALLGFVADIADSGQVALEKFSHGHYALLLTDLHTARQR